MKTIAIVLSIAALAGTILPGVLFMLDRLTVPGVHLWMLISTVVWYLSAPFWMDRQEQ
jgi:hypothetical protein